ncbi:hypothetical protein BC833DRAFT_546145 [Globomyces pollinis-pini]|nr:hypothetical protein BC833DRAFT_546145 [Globomyces pollinis-pini]
MMKRFWKQTSVKESKDNYSILLDQRQLKTPAGSVITIPKNNKLLAVLVAAEWESQQDVLKNYSLPLTSIMTRAVDSFEDQNTRQNAINTLLNYVHSDSICFHQDYPESFVKLQEEYWLPILDWVSSTYGVTVKTTDGICGIKQPDELINKLRKTLESYDNIKLAAFEKAVLRAKSFMIGLALIERRISVEYASMAARLEVQQQINRWGEVEDAHDIDRDDLKRQLGSAIATTLKDN